MQKSVTFTLIVLGFIIFSFERDACAQRLRYRNYSRNYYNYHYNRSPVFGIRSPYVRERRPLNVPPPSYSRSHPNFVYVHPQQTPFNPYLGPSSIPAFSNPWVGSYPSYLPYGAIPFYQPSSIRVIGPWQPTIIERERVIVERQPAETASKEAKATPQYHAETQSVQSTQVSDDRGDFSEQLKRAKQLFLDRNYREAADAYKQASGLNPGDASVKMGQSLAFLAMGDYVGAGSALRRALLLKPEWNEKPILLATYYGDLNDFNAHLVRLKRFVDSNKTHGEAQFLLAYLYVVLEREEDAVELLANLLDARPNDLEATTLLGRIASVRISK